jgi:long-chain acyl-CoA synthetase
MVVGQDQKHLGVLLLPSLHGFLKLGWSVTSLEELVDDDALRPLLHQEVQRLISAAHGFKRFERIGCVALLSKPFQIGEELTATYKLKRHVIFQEYHDLITQMYET